MHRKHGIDRGTEVTGGNGACGGYPSGLGRALLRKSYNVLPTNTTVLPLIFGIWFGVFPIGSLQLFNCSQPPDVQTVHGLSE